MAISLSEGALKANDMWDRSVPLEETFALIPQLRKRYGITRIGDTTFLDRTGIPNFCAVVPNTDDLITVYNGKGLTREAAIVSAVMEAVERQVAVRPKLPTFRESIPNVQRFIDLDVLALLPEARDLIVDCVEGTNLLTGATGPVPLALVQCPWFGDRLFRFTSTNGLASGNTLTEALYHALTELVERHTWSMYQGKCHLLPRIYFGPNAEDLPLAKMIQLPSGMPVIDELVSAVQSAGLTIRARWLEEKFLPVTMIASITESGLDMPMAHMGFGCSLNPVHALVRAITEAVQSRVVDIQAAREDILRPDDPRGIVSDHARRLKWIPRNQWYHDLPAEEAPLHCVPDESTPDVATDLQRVLAALEKIGIPQVIAVDISGRQEPVSVARVIVPEFETLALNGRIGPRIHSLFNPFSIT